MIHYLINISNISDGKMPKRSSVVKASNDGKNWQQMYYAQLELGSEQPFICVNELREINFPSSKGKNFSKLLVSEYEIDDIVMFGDKFLTRDGKYETKKDTNSGNTYWRLTKLAKSNNVPMLYTNMLRDVVIVKQSELENAVKILNNLL